MRTFFWIAITILLICAASPNAHADSYTATFTCTGTCLVPLPTAEPVKFAFATYPEVTWFFNTFFLSLAPEDAPTDNYYWYGTVVYPGTLASKYAFILTDGTTGDYSSAYFEGLPGNFTDHGTLTFSVTPTPDPDSRSLLLSGLALLALVAQMCKRLYPIRA
jgi:hypothetical protein